jgi:hypothetical protein
MKKLSKEDKEKLKLERSDPETQVIKKLDELKARGFTGFNFSFYDNIPGMPKHTRREKAKAMLKCLEAIDTAKPIGESNLSHLI